MTKLRVKGVFDVVTSNDSKIQIQINHNGIPGYQSPIATEAIIAFNNSTGTVTPVINDTNVSDEIIDLCKAYDQVYERRRVAWVKLRFIPKYTNFIQSIAEGDPPDESLTGFTNEIIYVVSDSNGLNGHVWSASTQGLLANATGVKLKKLNREFKVFRRSRKFPFAPKYHADDGADLLFPSGRWQNSVSNTTSSGGHPHTWILSDTLPMVAGVDLFTCVFEVKFEWADYKSVSS